MDWNRLRIFQTVAEQGSFTRAGDILELSQSAVSRQIAALEKSLGAVLFHRHSRGLLLTEQGDALYRTVREVSAKLAMTEARIADSRDRPSGPLKITTTVSFASVWLTPRIRTFNALYPEIKITLLTSDNLLDLSMREADVAIRMIEPVEPDLVRRHLMTVHSYIYASPDYLAQFGPIETVDDLARQRLIIYGQGPLTPIANPDWLIGISGDPQADGRIVLEQTTFIACAKRWRAASESPRCPTTWFGAANGCSVCCRTIRARPSTPSSRTRRSCDTPSVSGFFATSC